MDNSDNQSPSQPSNENSLKTNDVLSLSEIADVRRSFDVLKKIMGNKKDRLQELIRDCIKVGKLEYKLTIDGKHVNSDAILYRVHRYQDIYEQDFRRLVMSINAMEKLYSELAAGKTVKKVVATAKVCGFNRLNQANPPTTTSNEPSEANVFNLTPTKQDNSEILSQKTSQENLKNYSRKTKQGFLTPLKASNCHSPPAPKRRLISHSPRSSVKSSPKSVRFTTRPTTTQQISQKVLRSQETPQKDPRDNRYHCKICDKPFLKPHSLLVHMEFDHPPSLELSKIDVSGDLKTERTRKCEWCDKTFRSNASYSLHLKEHKLPARYAKRLNFSEHNYAMANESPKLDSQAQILTPQRCRSKRGPRSLRGRRDSDTSSCDSQIIPAVFHDNFFDPEISFDCSIYNPIIPIVPLSEEIVKEYLSYRS